MRTQANQNMIDLAITATGNLDSVMQICAANNTGITELPVAARDYVIPAGAAINITALQYLLANSIIPGTAYSQPVQSHRQHRRQFGKQFK